MLLVQQFLRNKSFKQLQEQHGVYASFSKSGHKWSLNYDQIEAQESDLLAQQCRGLILSAHGKSLASQAIMINKKLSYDHLIPGETQILAYPMNRFFNYGQDSAANINWNDPNLAILEKLDGTLCIVYWDPFTAQWCVATRSVPEADLLMDNGTFTFRSLFEKTVQETLKVSFETFTLSLNKDYTYCFELTTPYNRIVVAYQTCQITLLAVRNTISLQEVNLHQLDVGNLPIVNSYQFSSINDLVSWVHSRNPMQHEGIVVRDSLFQRIKIKNADYVTYSKARDHLSVSSRNCLQIILNEKDDDVIPFLPEEIVNNLQRIKHNLKLLIKEYDDLFKRSKEQADLINPGDKKTFALIVTKNKNYWSAPLFAMFDSKASNMKDFIHQNRKEGTWPASFLDNLLKLMDISTSVSISTN